VMGEKEGAIFLQSKFHEANPPCTSEFAFLKLLDLSVMTLLILLHVRRHESHERKRKNGFRFNIYIYIYAA
jgi:hypothetical protein